MHAGCDPNSLCLGFHRSSAQSEAIRTDDFIENPRAAGQLQTKTSVFRPQSVSLFQQPLVPHSPRSPQLHTDVQGAAQVIATATHRSGPGPAQAPGVPAPALVRLASIAGCERLPRGVDGTAFPATPVSRESTVAWTFSAA